MHATPNQHLLTLPSSPVGKSSDLHAEVQQFKAQLRTQVFFFFTHILSHFLAYTHIHMHTRTMVRVYVYVCR